MTPPVHPAAPAGLDLKRRAEALFEEALEVSHSDREPWLAVACGGDTELLRLVRRLLAADARTSGVLEVPAERLASMLVPLQRVGPYRLGSEIGRGGMGSVHRAERDDGQFRQTVAVKLMRRGVDAEEHLGRFRAERQILASLRYPNIASLLDGGLASDGRPYLVMELVEGEPITRYADARALSVEARLRLFLQVCRAVQYAHRNLVVHRDLKPSNILVTADGTVKLLDFGIAKLLDAGEHPAEAPLTRTGARVLTPEYAAPEQVQGGPITTATDVYALGLILYELLCGQRPYTIEGKSWSEVERLVCMVEPARPSAVRLRRRLRGDLDNIALTALAKEPERRYASVEQFAEDVRRHLEGLPVRARPASFGYRAGKFIRRHKVGVAAACVAAAALLAVTAAALWQGRVARAERARAERRFDEVRQLANSFVFEVHDEIQNLPGSTRARSLIVQRALKYLDSLAQEAGGDLSLQRELAAAYDKLGVVLNTPTVAHLGDRAGAVESHRKAAALREALVAAEPSNADYLRELLDSRWHLAVLTEAGGDLPRALHMIRQQLAGRERLAAAAPSNLVDRYNLAGTYTMMGVLRMEMGDAAGALENQRRALALREELAATDPSRARARRALSISYEHLGAATAAAGDVEGALGLQRRGLELRESLISADPLNTDLRLMLAASHRYLGDLLDRSGDAAGAAEHYRKLLALEEEMVAADAASVQFRSNLSTALVRAGVARARAGDAAGALLYYRRALGVRKELAAGDSGVSGRRDLAEAHVKVGEALAAAGARAEALSHYHAAVQTLEALSESAPAHVGVRVMLGEACAKAGGLHVALATAAPPATAGGREHWRAALASYRRSLEVWEDLRARGAEFRGRLASHVDPFKTVSAEIARCDAALGRPL